MQAPVTFSINELIRSLTKELEKKYNDPLLCTHYAWWVIEAITKTKKNNLITQQTITLSATQQEQLDTWISRQVNEHIPLQYLLGSVPFIDATILVEPPILIPRPETENWVAELIVRLRSVTNQSFTILDMCTGSGCIAIALAQAFPHATIYATDIAPQALALAQKNARLNQITSITFLQSDLFEAIRNDLRFDMIIANPPYISMQEWQTLDPSVKEWEDQTALIASDNGLSILKKIIEQSPAYIKSNHELIALHLPQLVVEIGHLQGAAVQRLFQENNFYDTVIEKDLQGNDRIVSGCMYYEELR